MTNKEYYKGVGIGYIVLIIVIVLTYVSCGCNVQKKAEARVLSNEQSFNKIGVRWSKINPAINDTTITGKSDTSYSEDTIYLTEKVPVAVTAKMVTSDKSSVFNYTLRKYIRIHDTSFRYIRDIRAENILDDSLRSAQFNLKVSEGEKEAWKEKAQDRFKALFIVIALFVIGLIIKFYSKNIFSGLKGFITGI